MAKLIIGYGVLVEFNTWDSLVETEYYKKLEAFSDFISFVRLSLSPSDSLKVKYFIGFTKVCETFDRPVCISGSFKAMTTTYIDNIFLQAMVDLQPEPLVIMEN